MSDPYHTPVLLQACIDYLKIKPDGVYVDLTFGGSGHSRAILAALGPEGRLFAFDQDEDAKRNAPDDKRFTLVPENFRYVKSYLRVHGVTKVDGILGDLGVSSHQFDVADRGFSLRFEGPLDMRMNRRTPLTAAEVLNTYSKEELAAIFRNYGEVQQAGKMARLITEARGNAPLKTTGDLKTALKEITPKFGEHKFLARVFQALRIEVNGEVDALKECLAQCAELLVDGGRLVMISYHSLEDRLVKNLIRTGNVEGDEKKDMIYGTSEKVFRNLTTRAVTADDEEIRVNSRARSAKLRAAEKI